MEQKEIDIDYFKKANTECYKLLSNKKYKEAKKALVKPIQELEEHKLNTMYCPQNIFEAAILLNFVEKSISQKDFAKINVYDFYLMAGAASYNLGNLQEARTLYEKAIAVNPTSAVARLQIMEIDKREKQFESFLEQAKEFFKFAYRRSHIARGYRNVGYYLYEKKDFEMSIVAYYLSNVYELSELATNEVKHIAMDMNIDLNATLWLSEECLKNLLDKYGIPLLPNQELVNLAKAMAEDAKSKQAFQAEQFACQVVYDLTLETEYLDRIKEISDWQEKTKGEKKC